MCPGLRGPVLSGALALLWCSTFAWIKIALDAFTPTQLTFARMLLGALALCAMLAITRDHLPRDANTWVRFPP